MADALDLIEARHGWTDEQTLALPFARFLQVLRRAGEAERAEMRKRAWLAWQVNMSKLSFGEYLRTVGLGEEKSVSEATTKEQVLKRAEEILTRLKG